MFLNCLRHMNARKQLFALSGPEEQLRNKPFVVPPLSGVACGLWQGVLQKWHVQKGPEKSLDLTRAPRPTPAKHNNCIDSPTKLDIQTTLYNRYAHQHTHRAAAHVQAMTMAHTGVHNQTPTHTHV